MVFPDFHTDPGLNPGKRPRSPSRPITRPCVKFGSRPGFLLPNAEKPGGVFHAAPWQSAKKDRR